jgi:hypothetical protein
LLLAVACQRSGEGPKVASSAEQVGYAEHYPDELQRLETSVNRDNHLDDTLADFKKFPDELSNTDWELVGTIYKAADEEGRGAAYAARYDEQATVSRFFDEEKKPIVGRASSAVTYAAKEKGYEDLQPYGPISFGMDKGISQQLEDRRRSDSTAQLTISEQENKLGKRNVPALQKQADLISLTSHIVYVRVMLDEQELSRRIDEASAVRSTLEDRKEALGKAEKPDKAAIERTDQALAAIDDRVAKAKAAMEGAEKRRQDLQKQYETALDGLLDEVDRRRSASK